MKKFKAIEEKIRELPESKMVLGLSLLSKIEFMDEELDKLQKRLKKDGWVEEYQNGANQKGVKKSSYGDAYNTMIKNYNTTVKALNDILPDESGEVDELLDFISRK